MLEAIGLCSCVITYAIYSYYSNWNRVKHLPGYKQFFPCSHIVTGKFITSPLIRRFPQLKQYFTDRSYIHEVLLEKMKTQPDAKIFSVASLEEAYVAVCDPDVVHEVVIEKRDVLEKPLELYKVLDLFGPSIVSTNGSEWKKHRSLSQPGFSESNLKLVAEATSDLSYDLFNKWDEMLERSPNAPIEVDGYMNEFTLAIISHAGFGLKIEDAFVRDQYIDYDTMSFKTALTIVSQSLVTRMIAPKSFGKWFPSIERVYRAFDVFEQKLLEMIRSRQTAGGLEFQEHRDLLSLLAKAEEDGSVLTQKEVLSDAFMFLLAGHETTSHTLTFALHMLAANPDVQEKLYQEVIEVLGEDRRSEYGDYKDLMLSRCTIKEALRFFPAVPSIPKVPMEDLTLAGQLVKKGTNVRIVVHALHLSERYWKDPMEFKPERFDTRVNPNPHHMYAYIPFAAGARSCIGMKFAQVESALLLSELVRRYRFELPKGVSPDLEVENVITLQAVNPVKLIVKKRKE